jgi:uncharacterized cysteine cluster protein YcgN (CxxCxxCC family)
MGSREASRTETLMSFPMLPVEKYEALCRRCGMSCHTPILLGSRTVIVPEIHCRFLAYDAEGKAACTVYENRYEAAPWCRSAEEAIELNALGWDCPYAAGVPGFKGKHWAKDWEHEAVVDAMKKVLPVKGLPVEDNPDSALRLLESNGGGEWTYEQDGDVFRFREKSPRSF